MPAPDYTHATFLLSVAELDQLPPDEGMEVAIIGRSNAGKSSVLNQLTQNAKLARVSKTPGRTQHINLFSLDDQRRLADLPGYGYAKVPLAVKQRWQQLLGNYLTERQCLRGLLMVMDIRHPLKPFDLEMLAWAAESQLAVHILLNKADKLTQQAAAKSLREVKAALAGTPGDVSVQTFSALKGAGAKALRDKLLEWFALGSST
jgi:GTP-binding protein